MTEVSPQATAHATLGASNSKRWINCPGSVRLSAAVPPSPSSVHAEEGTAAHEVAALCLTTGQDAIEFVGRTFNGFVIDADQADAIQVYVDHCRTRETPRRWIEHRISLAALNPPAPMFGTADHMAYADIDGTLWVDDLKFGRGVVVEAADNTQLKYYALGAMLAVHPLPVRRVVATIVQPRKGGIATAEYDAFDLMEWSAELLASAAATQAPDAPLKAGPWCASTFCPAAGSCAANAAQAVAVAQAEFGAAEYAPPAPGAMDSATIGRLLAQAPLFEGWLKALRDEAERRAHLADPALGWQIVATEGREAWILPRDVIRNLSVEADIPERTLTEPVEPVSPAKARGIIADRARTAAMLDGAKLTKKDAEAQARKILAPFVRRPAGTALVPATDSRPALAGAGSEFSTLPAITQES